MNDEENVTPQAARVWEKISSSSQVSSTAGINNIDTSPQVSLKEEEETNTKPLTIRTKPTSMDIYALGCVLLQMWWIPESLSNHVDNVDPDLSMQQHKSRITTQGAPSSKRIMSFMPFNFKNRLMRLGFDESTMTSWIPLHLPPEVASITLRALSREPAKRPTAADIVEVISTALKHHDSDT